MVYLSPFSFSSPSPQRRNTPTFLSQIGKRKRERERAKHMYKYTRFSQFCVVFFLHMCVCVSYSFYRAAVFIYVCVRSSKNHHVGSSYFSIPFFITRGLSTRKTKTFSWASYLYHVQFFILWKIYITYMRKVVFTKICRPKSANRVHISREWRNEEGKGSETCINGGI